MEIADSTIRSLIIISAVTASAKKEVLSMSIRHFIEGTKEYHQMDIPKNLEVEEQHNFIKEVLEKLDNFEDIVVTFKLVRAKFQKNYYTFCTPECSKHLICMLKERIQTREFYNEKTIILTSMLVWMISCLRLIRLIFEKDLQYLMIH